MHCAKRGWWPASKIIPEFQASDIHTLVYDTAGLQGSAQPGPNLYYQFSSPMILLHKLSAPAKPSIPELSKHVLTFPVTT